jgi:hypothetical protein
VHYVAVIVINIYNWNLLNLFNANLERVPLYTLKYLQCRPVSPIETTEHPTPDFNVSFYDIPLASLSLIECLTLSISYWKGCALAVTLQKRLRDEITYSFGSEKRQHHLEYKKSTRSLVFPTTKWNS